MSSTDLDDERRKRATAIFNIVLKNDSVGLEQFSYMDNMEWRDMARYALDLKESLDTALGSNPLIPYLLQYEITSLSSFHLAAMLGLDDVLVVFMDRDIPVDMGLGAGTTALHLASFGGKVDTVKMLVEVYKADVNRRDRYGWSALHFASAEGHLEIVKYLVTAEINIYFRDKDGTTAAFRAHAANHADVVDYLCTVGEEDELLNVEQEHEGVWPDEGKEDNYSLPRKQNKQRSNSMIEDNPVYVSAGLGPLNDNEKRSALQRKQSEPALMMASKPMADISHSHTMPVRHQKKFGRRTIRRLIRHELEAAFGPDYELPINLSPEQTMDADDEGDGGQHNVKIKGIGVNTLKGILREEFEKYRAMSFKNDSSELSNDVFDDQDDNSDYEDAYATLKDLPLPPPPPIPTVAEEVSDTPPGAPPVLPPRNPTQSLKSDMAGNAVQLDKQASSNALLTATFQKLSPILGSDWKKLAKALPIAPTSKVESRIEAISKQHPKDVQKQANAALAEWRINMGKSADIDDLIEAMKRCGLKKLIAEVEKVSQEFTA